MCSTTKHNILLLITVLEEALSMENLVRDTNRRDSCPIGELKSYSKVSSSSSGRGWAAAAASSASCLKISNYFSNICVNNILIIADIKGTRKKPEGGG